MPPSNPTREASKLRTGPYAVRKARSRVQVPPVPQSAPDWHGPPGVGPPVQTPGVGAPGSGNFKKLGGAVGMGDFEVRLLFWVNPENPVSAPPSNGDPPFGSLSGPNVRWAGL